MSKILVSKLQPGMKLAKPIKNDGGVVMLAENTELTDSLIKRLEKMNIDSVSIVGGSKPEKSPEELLAELGSRFRKTENEPHMGMLKKIFQEHIKEMAQ